MPAASSKPAPQTTPSEGQDAVKQLVGVVEKKIRNLEKRKTKLDGYRATVSSGKPLNKDQEEAVSHFEEVSASLEFAKELSKQFTSILAEAAKAQKKEAKREKQHRHEQDLERISEVLLLQNVLIHMGQENVRADFLAGADGALHLEEQELANLDEFFKLVSPTRENEEDDAEEAAENLSFDKKLEKATNHLNSYLREEEREVCQTTYKELYQLVQRVHKCGYLDNIPPIADEIVPVVEETAPASVPYELPDEQQPQVQGDEEEEEEYEETYQEPVQEPMSEVPSESYYVNVGSEQLQSPVMQGAPVEVGSMQSGMVAEQQPTQQAHLSEMVIQSRVLDVPQAPEPIEMPPRKPPHHDVNEVLAPVLGNFNFVQDSMLDYDSPHMDPAVVAVSQPFIPSATFVNSVQSAEMSQADASSQSMVREHQTLDTLTVQQQSLGAPSQLPAEQTYQSQSRYDSPQQGYSSQGLPDQTQYASQTIEGGSTGYVSQVDMANTSVQVDYGSSQAASTGKLNELPEFPSPPVDTQLAKQQEQNVLQSTMLSQHSLTHSSTQYTSTGLGASEGYSQSIGTSQLAADGVSAGLTSQMAQGSSSSPLTITDPSQATIPLPGEQSSTDVSQGSIPPPKSTMNASAPPFQMTNTLRSSPQMQPMQSSPPGQVGQAPELVNYQTTLEQSQDYNHSGGRELNRAQSPAQDGKLNQPGVQSNDSSGSSFSNYQPYYNRNGRGGKPRGAQPNFRGNRGPAPFIRGSRFNSPQPPRELGQMHAVQALQGQMAQFMSGPGNFNAYVHRDAFAPRGPDMSYNPNARYGGFNQMQDQSFYQRRGNMPRAGQRGGRGTPGGPRNQAPYRGGRGTFGKPAPQVSA